MDMLTLHGAKNAEELLQEIILNRILSNDTSVEGKHLLARVLYRVNKDFALRILVSGVISAGEYMIAQHILGELLASGGVPTKETLH